MKKKVLALILVLLLLLSAMGCQQRPAETPTGSGEQTSEESGVEEKGESDTDISVRQQVRIGISKHDLVTDYEDNLLTDELEGRMNCDITFDVLPSGDNGRVEMQLMILGNQPLPDVFAIPLGDALTYEYASAGAFVPLNEWCEDPEVTPNLHNVVSEEDKNAMLQAATSPDGNIYALVRYEPELQMLTPYHLYINTVWLDYLGLTVPTTSEELADVLIAFAEDDPNGNGEKDEIPLLIRLEDNAATGCNALVPLMNMFLYAGPQLSSFALSEDGREVIVPQLTDEYRDGLRYIRDLYDAGAITEDSFAFGEDADAFKNKLNQPVSAENGRPVSECTVGMFSARSIPSLFDGAASGKNTQFAEYQMMAVPTGPMGVSYSPYLAPSATKCWYVTRHAEDPAFCVMLGDCFYDPEISLMARYGEKDVDWTNDETFCADWYKEHTVMLEGSGLKQPVQDFYSLVLLRSDAILVEESSAYWYNVQPRYSSLEFSEHIVDFYDPNTFVTGSGSYGSITAQVRDLYGGEQPDHLLPALTLTPEEQNAIGEYEVGWSDMVLQNTFMFMATATVTDAVTKEAYVMDVDSDTSWQDYLDEMNGLAGAAQMQAVYQAAYERTEQYKTLLDSAAQTGGK